MRVLVVHSDVGADARPDDLDTLTSAEAVATALLAQGHVAELAPFAASPDDVRRTLEAFRADAVFNMVECVFGQDSLAAIAPSIFEKIGVPYTGNASAPIAVTGDKPLAKRLMRAAGLPTPDWSEPPAWDGFDDARTYIVKSATEDASLGLDDAALVRGRAGSGRAYCIIRCSAFAAAGSRKPMSRAASSTWLSWKRQAACGRCPCPKCASMIGQPPSPASWATAPNGTKGPTTPSRRFARSGSSAKPLRLLVCCPIWRWKRRGSSGSGAMRVSTFGQTGTASPSFWRSIANPCLDPHAGFAAAAAEAGLRYETLIGFILAAARSRG